MNELETIYHWLKTSKCLVITAGAGMGVDSGLIGSGPHVQSIRKKTRMLGIDYHANILRINTKDSKIKAPHIGMEQAALVALTTIDQFIEYKEKGIQENP